MILKGLKMGGMKKFQKSKEVHLWRCGGERRER
jgi:hypothetical protein